MRRIIAGILESYGTKLRLEHGGETVELRGFLQPVRSKDKGNWEYTLREAGEYPEERFIYIGPPDVPAARGDVILQGEKRYTLRRTEKIFAGDGAAYGWGLCMKEETEPWTASSKA